MMTLESSEEGAEAIAEGCLGSGNGRAAEELLDADEGGGERWQGGNNGGACCGSRVGSEEARPDDGSVSPHHAVDCRAQSERVQAAGNLVQSSDICGLQLAPSVAWVYAPHRQGLLGGGAREESGGQGFNY
ncbi:hypothetical protein PtB15_1B967 [Puccinia triticina]|nr:hypothetical protein PtB15_1B967 [Puccinia triticina]